ncbi:maleylacetoacetate isomerase [Roseibium sediminicola]|uniref:Maleylacetoacetate isomerase n=1 Tax=Roseibium sediminicola TaxID=2933272 RepID=A0ABT0GX76_9HYPH|nr:maleylacetoacetate isomerase [Roseibium sp. CAU 1639]MCK7613845.1 maleylacetoacetate isomerase [Roseibium sp. CAU 1639]
MAKDIVFYDYWRSSASYRVRIALNLLGLDADYRPVNLLTRAHLEEDYLKLNPQGLLPAIIIDGKTLTQSLAIIEYLNATIPGSQLLPGDIDGQYRVRQLAYAIAMEIHPVCNLGVVKHLSDITGGGDEAKKAWMQHFIGKGLAAFEDLLDDTGPFCHGDRPTMADCCLIPQLYNAERWGVDLSSFSRIARVADACNAIGAFRNAHPDVIGAPPA